VGRILNLLMLACPSAEIEIEEIEGSGIVTVCEWAVNCAKTFIVPNLNAKGLLLRIRVSRIKSIYKSLLNVGTGDSRALRVADAS
jgi:hypothetical protein